MFSFLTHKNINSKTKNRVKTQLGAIVKFAPVIVTAKHLVKMLSTPSLTRVGLAN